MKKIVSVLIGVFAAVFILAGCSDLLNKPVSPADGRGVVTVNIGGGKNARTLLPGKIEYDFYYEVTFIPTNGGDSVISPAGKGTIVKVNLFPGEWTVNVNGFLSKDNAKDKSNAVVTGNEEFTVKAGEETSVRISVTPNADKLLQSEGGKGKLAYSITLPREATGSLKVLTLAETETKSVDLADNPIGEIMLDSSSYYIIVSAKYNGKEKTWRELAQIFDNAVTKAEKIFAEEHFTASASTKIKGNSFNTGGAARDASIDDEDGNDQTIEIIAPGADLTNLKPVFEFEGAMITPAPGEAPQFDSNGSATYTVYTESGEATTYTVNIINEINSVELLGKYLKALPSNDKDNAYPAVKVNVNLDTEWNKILTELEAAGKYVDLDFSDSTGMQIFNADYTVTKGKDKIVSLVLPTDTKTTGDKTAFGPYPNLTHIEGAGLTTVGKNAFDGHTSLKSFDFPKLETIEPFAFQNCTGLTEANIPDGVTIIPDHAFYGCGKLTNVTISNSVTIIGASAFSMCFGLKEITIPAGVQIIKNYAFHRYQGTKVIFEGDNVSFDNSNSDIVFPGDLAKAYKNGKKGTYIKWSNPGDLWKKTY